MPNLKQILAVSAIGIALILGVVAYNVFKTPAEASGPIQAIPLAETGADSSTGTTATQSASGAAAVAEPEATEVAADAAAEPAADDGASTESSAPITLQIVQAESEAQFIIDEVLNNAPKTVVGTTDQVAGEIAIDPQDPAQTRIGVIQVNARTLVTDSDFRNRAIKNQILETDQYEFVTFTPTQIIGLPESGAVGEAYSFQIVGDLTIRDVTKSVTFDVTTTAASATRLEGTATTTINYADYGITIPSVRQVASVADQVQLALNFVAVAS